jgi:hypothetical protein
MAGQHRRTTRRRRSTASENPTDTMRMQIEAILTIVERNTTRISRLEDVFALHVQQRDEVAQALKDVRALLRRRRR